MSKQNKTHNKKMGVKEKASKIETYSGSETKFSMTFLNLKRNKQITMEMFFRDMRCAELDSPKRHLRFKIDHPLCHYRRDYAHDDPSHFVVIEFSSGLDAERVAQEVRPPAAAALAVASGGRVLLLKKTIPCS